MPIKIIAPQCKIYKSLGYQAGILKLTNAEEAEKEVNHWLWWASRSNIPAFHALCKKIKRQKKHILTTILLGLCNALVEKNNKIKLII